MVVWLDWSRCAFHRLLRTPVRVCLWKQQNSVPRLSQRHHHHSGTLVLLLLLQLLAPRHYYCLLCSWFCAEVVSFDTTRVRARFSARRRSFSVLYFCNSWFDVKSSSCSSRLSNMFCILVGGFFVLIEKRSIRANRTSKFYFVVVVVE